MAITQLPSELLESIFYEISDGKPVISPIPHPRRTKRELGASKLACKLWRTIICSLDKFYVVTCSLPNYTEKPQHASTYSRWMLESKNCDIDIGWLQTDVTREWPEDWLGIHFAKPFRSQWRLFILKNLEPVEYGLILADLSALKGPMPRLTELRIDTVGDSGQNKDAVADVPAGLLNLDASALKDLSFLNADYDESCWPAPCMLQSLRSLTLSFTRCSRLPSPEVVAKLLGDAAALISLSLNINGNVSMGLDVQVESFFVHLPRLSTLDLTVSPAYAGRLLSKLELSNLRTFIYHIGQFDSPSEDVIARYPQGAIQLHRLRELSLTTHHYTEGFLFLRFLQVPHLEILRVEATIRRNARVRLDGQRIELLELRNFSLKAYGEDIIRALQYVLAPNLVELAIVLAKRTNDTSWPFKRSIIPPHPLLTVEKLDLSLSSQTLREPTMEELRIRERTVPDDPELVDNPTGFQDGAEEPNAPPLAQQQLELQTVNGYVKNAISDVGAGNQPIGLNDAGGIAGENIAVLLPVVIVSPLRNRTRSHAEGKRRTTGEENNPLLELFRLLPKARLRSLTIRNQPCTVWPHVVSTNTLEMRQLLSVHLSFDDHKNWKALLDPLRSRDLANVQVLRLDANVPSGSLNSRSFNFEFLWSTTDQASGGEVEVPLRSLKTLQVLLPKGKGDTGFMQELRNLLIMRNQMGYPLERLQVSPPPPSPYSRQSIAKYVRNFEGYVDGDSFPPCKTYIDISRPPLDVQDDEV